MNDSPTLRFHGWHQPEKVFTLRAWRASEGLAFAVDSEGQQHVLRFMRLTGAGGDETWHPPPFPEELPTKIEEIRLVPPPSRANETEAERLRKESAAKKLPSGTQPIQVSAHRAAQPWESARLRYDPEVLTPQPEDNGLMTTRLDELRIRVQREYEARTQEVKILIGLLDEGQLTDCDACFYAHLVSGTLNTGGERFLLDQERLRLRYSTPDCSKWTLDDAYQWPLIRNPILRARWAKQNNWDFQQNATKRKELFDWLGIPAPSLEMQLPKVFSLSLLSKPPPTNYESDKYTDPLSDLGVANGNEMLVAATARCCVTFANGQSGWLEDCRFRQPQNQDERQEFAYPHSPALGPSNNDAARIEKAATEIAASAKDLKETLGKVPEVFADPLAAAARAASIERGAPDVFIWWVFQEWHSGKFPTVDGAFKRCGLGLQLKQTGLAFSRASVGRWLKIIGDELDKRQLRQKRSSESSSSKARDFDVARATNTGPRPGNADEPPEAFVNWVGDRDAAGAMPTEEDVLAYVRACVGDFGLASCSEDKLRKIAARWLKAAVKILNSVPTDRLETNEEDSPL